MVSVRCRAQQQRIGRRKEEVYIKLYFYSISYYKRTIIAMRASSVLLFCCAAVTGIYASCYPWYGAAYDMNSVSSYRIGLPVEAGDKCNVSSDVNMSLRLGYASGAISLVITVLMSVYSITPKNTKGWSVNIVWITSIIALLCQLLVFSIIVARISVWFLSCTNASKIGSSCPATRYKALRGEITDVEQCYFHPVTLTLYSETDMFLDCLNEIEFQNYNSAFGRYDLPAYYTASALCVRNETATLGLDISWCYNWGCSKECNHDMYLLNSKLFILDIALLVLILASYIVVMSEFYIVRGVKQN